MNRTLLIIRREFTSRVKKKSFLLTTILTPLLIPALLFALVYFAQQEKEDAIKQTVHVLDNSGLFVFQDTQEFDFVEVSGELETAKTAFQESADKALIYIPEFDLYKPEGFVVYAKSNLSLSTIDDFKDILDGQIEKVKLEETGIDPEVIANLRTNVGLRAINLTESGEEKESSAGVTFGIGYAAGFLIYMFIFIYGAQIMQGVIEEKSSRVVEIIISSVRPFQLMMGKVLGIASVGFAQLAIWILLITVLSTVVLSAFGLTSPQEMAMDQVTEGMANIENVEAQTSSEMQNVMRVINDIPYGLIMFSFVFYFIGGYLLYGALFAAVGSAVDTPADAQQFMLPITIPLIISIIALPVFILDNPDSTTGFWLSIIPFTSPVAMMGRIAFGVPAWELILSMLMLIGGFVLTIWVAGRIYRVGILLHGTKVNYRVLAKWFMQRG